MVGTLLVPARPIGQPCSPSGHVGPRGQPGLDSDSAGSQYDPAPSYRPFLRLSFLLCQLHSELGSPEAERCTWLPEGTVSGEKKAGKKPDRLGQGCGLS